MAYPTHLVSQWVAPDGTAITIRPIRPDDADIERAFVAALSPEARYLRFMTTVKELTPAMLARFTQIDYDREMALIAVVCSGNSDVQVGVARYVTDEGGLSCEFAVVIAEQWQGRGLGRHLMLLLIGLARARGLKTMTGHILAANTRMLAMARAMGFTIEDTPHEFAVKHVRLVIN